VRINIAFPQTKELRAHLLQDDRLGQYLDFLANHHRETYLHTLRVCSLSLDLGLENNLDTPTLMNLGHASLLHDIGKALIPKDLLAKTTGLDSLEQQIMREHVRLGFHLLDEFKPDIVKQIVAGHHEFSRFPYPRSGSERRQAPRASEPRRNRNPTIDRAVQILAIADMSDALVQPRAYKNAFTKERTETTLRREFTGDPDLIDQVLRRLNEA
jgi:HD-GYP domain-containing protein (c-di-GMP phosphodiesterase class II)